MLHAALPFAGGGWGLLLQPSGRQWRSSGDRRWVLVRSYRHYLFKCRIGGSIIQARAGRAEFPEGAVP